MKNIIKLNLTDIKNIISEHYNVNLNCIDIIDAGYEYNDGPYPGRGYYCDIEVDLTDSNKSNNTSAWDFHYSGHGDYEEERRCFYGDFS